MVLKQDLDSVLTVDTICDEFERCWSLGTEPNMEAFLEKSKHVYTSSTRKRVDLGADCGFTRLRFELVLSYHTNVGGSFCPLSPELIARMTHHCERLCRDQFGGEGRGEGQRR